MGGKAKREVLPPRVVDQRLTFVELGTKRGARGYVKLLQRVENTLHRKDVIETTKNRWSLVDSRSPIPLEGAP